MDTSGPNQTPAQTLNKYIHQQLATGLQPNEIAQHLSQAGWTQEHIDQAFALVQQQTVPTTQSAPIVIDQNQQPVGQVIPTGNFGGPIVQRGRIKTGWLLLKQSFKVLKHNKSLVRYVLMSMLLCVVAAIFFSIILFSAGDTFILKTYNDVTFKNDYSPTSAGYGVILLAYIVSYFIINFYSAGLTANVLDIFKGSSGPYKSYMKIARGKAKQLLIFSVIEATIGLLLKMIAERSKLVGRIITTILGAVWTIATLFVVPVIVTSDDGAFSAIKKSTQIVKSTWGENLVSRGTINGFLFLFGWLIFIPLGLIFFMIGAFIGGSIGIAVAMYLFWILIIALILIANTLTNILNTALFYFAQNKQVPAAFDAQLLNSVYTQKVKRHGLLRRKVKE